MSSPSSLVIDPHMLTNVVRSALQSPTFVVHDWRVSALANRGGTTPDGVVRVSGNGEDAAGVRRWTVALKRLARPDPDAPADDLFFHRRELRFYQSPWLTQLPGPVLPARCYGVVEDAEAIWLWTEVLQDETGGQWSLDDYAFAADQLGRFHGACVHTRVPPLEPWFAHAHAKQWTDVFAFAPAWEQAQVQALFPPAIQTRLQHLVAQRDTFFARLDHLPQTFSHFDYKRDNLFLRTRDDGVREVAAVDWAVCGVGALGGDLVSLVGASTWQFDWEPSQIKELDRVAFAAYIGGLRSVGWEGDRQLLRLAYCTWCAMHFGLIIPACVAWAMDSANDQDGARLFGRSAEERITGWMQLCTYALDCADEAQQLYSTFPNLPPRDTDT